MGMSEAEKAWQLWHRLQKLSNELWARYDREFWEFCNEERRRNEYFDDDHCSSKASVDVPF